MELTFSFNDLTDLKYTSRLAKVSELSAEGQILYDNNYQGFKIRPATTGSSYFKTPLVYLQEGDRLEISFDLSVLNSAVSADRLVFAKAEGINNVTDSGVPSGSPLNESVRALTSNDVNRTRTYLIRQKGWYRVGFGYFSYSVAIDDFYLKNCYARFISNRNLNVVENFADIDLTTGVFSAFSDATKPVAKLQWSSGNDLELVLSGAVKPNADISSNSAQLVGTLPQEIIDVLSVNVFRDSEVNIPIIRKYSKDTRLQIRQNGTVSIFGNTEDSFTAGDYISLACSVVFY